MGWRTRLALSESKGPVEVEIRAKKGRAQWMAALHRVDTGECLTGRHSISSQVGPRREVAEQALISALNGIHRHDLDWVYKEAGRLKVLEIMRECPACGALIPRGAGRCKWCKAQPGVEARNPKRE